MVNDPIKMIIQFYDNHCRLDLVEKATGVSRYRLSSYLNGKIELTERELKNIEEALERSRNERIRH